MGIWQGTTDINTEINSHTLQLSNSRAEHTPIHPIQQHHPPTWEAPRDPWGDFWPHTNLLHRRGQHRQKIQISAGHLKGTDRYHVRSAEGINRQQIQRIHQVTPHIRHPIWFPYTSQTCIEKLQRVQNAACRIATGSIKLSAGSHLQAKTKMLHVQDHLSLLSS